MIGVAEAAAQVMFLTHLLFTPRAATSSFSFLSFAVVMPFWGENRARLFLPSGMAFAAHSASLCSVWYLTFHCALPGSRYLIHSMGRHPERMEAKRAESEMGTLQVDSSERRVVAVGNALRAVEAYLPFAATLEAEMGGRFALQIDLAPAET